MSGIFVKNKHLPETIKEKTTHVLDTLGDILEKHLEEVGPGMRDKMRAEGFSEVEVQEAMQEVTNEMMKSLVADFVKKLKETEEELKFHEFPKKGADSPTVLNK